MKTTQAQQIINIIKDIERNVEYSDLNAYISEYINIKHIEEIEDIEALKDYLIEINDGREITDVQIIYFASAMDYLKRNDPSLQESLGLAYDYGFTADKINSELLASIHASEENIEIFNDMINNIIEEIETQGLLK